jgi:glycosyltransferase involved in cell wall biosynthesis
LKVILECQHAVSDIKIRGIGFYTLNLTKALLERKTFDYELAFFDYNRERNTYLRANQYFGGYGVPLNEVNDVSFPAMADNDAIFEKKTYNDITGTNGDVYHFMNIFSVPTNLVGKIAVSIHDMSFRQSDNFNLAHTNAWYNEGVRRCEKLTQAHILTLSEASKSDILKYTNISEDRISVVNISYNEKEHYVDKDPTAINSLGIEGDYLLFVGTVEHKKNVERIVKAFNIIAHSNKDIKLVLAGEKKSGRFENVENAIESSKYKNRIISLDYVDNDIKRKLYSGAAAFVFPSLNEGFGIPILEAMACGCPVITANTTSCPEVAGNAALLINPLSVEEIADAMQKITSSETLRDDLTKKGFENIKRFSWDKTAKQTENIYRKLCE